MTHLLDTDVLIDYLNGKGVASRLAAELMSLGIAISVMTYGEIYEGIYFGHHPHLVEQAWRQLLESVTTLPGTTLVMHRFARIRGELRRRGLRLEDADLLIAATAVEHDLTLVTRNLRHFARVPGLRLYHQS